MDHGVDPPASEITALLGPTNTGKTHRALSRMLDYDTGMIGLPLRLLAREVYDRLTARVGENAVALLTGEERRVGRRARYFVCTTEAMPLEREVDFLAVDEIQLAAHPERGHAFTERLERARGRRETWFLGASTIRPLLTELLPTARVLAHPRLSALLGTPPKKLGALPPRSAVVAFSVNRVYEMAERLRHKKGGAAVVLGALSPRTRNAQVAMYEAGEVNYLVATDAIGMGLNLSLSHVAFADVKKFDGRESRPLELHELGQIAGRAGRYLSDGTFGVLEPLPAFAPRIVDALVHHRFVFHRRLVWRNADLDFSNLDALRSSLVMPPKKACFRLIERALDTEVLLALGHDPTILARLTSSERVALLWEVCQIPDYKQLLFELHVRLLGSLFLQLTGEGGRISDDWLVPRLRTLNDARGDIETLMARLAEIRIFAYVANRRDWVRDPAALAEEVEVIEHRLSDALHERLVARFVQTRTLTREVMPRGNPQGNQSPFAALFARLTPRHDTAPEEQLTERIVDASHEQLSLDAHGRIVLQEHGPIGRIVSDGDLLHPEVRVRLTPEPAPGARRQIERRLLAFARDVVAQLLAPLRTGAQARLSPIARGLVYQLECGLGSLPVELAATELSATTPRDREVLRSLGVCFGEHHLFLRRGLTPERIGERLGLLSDTEGLDELRASPGIGFVALRGPPVSPLVLVTIGYAALGGFALRLDVHEKLRGMLRHLATRPSFALPIDFTARVGQTEEKWSALLAELGFEALGQGRFRGAVQKRPRRRKRRRPVFRASSKAHSPVDENSDG